MQCLQVLARHMWPLTEQCAALSWQFLWQLLHTFCHANAANATLFFCKTWVQLDVSTEQDMLQTQHQLVTAEEEPKFRCDFLTFGLPTTYTSMGCF